MDFVKYYFIEKQTRIWTYPKKQLNNKYIYTRRDDSGFLLGPMYIYRQVLIRSHYHSYLTRNDSVSKYLE